MSSIPQNCSDVQPERPQVARDPAALRQLVTARIESGSPFSSPRTAWQGCEQIGEIAGMYFSFAIFNFELSVRATDTFQLYGCLPVATRLERGRYESICSPEQFDIWLGAMLGAAPIVELPAPEGQTEKPAANGKFTYDIDAVLAPDRLNRKGGHYRNFNNPHRYSK